MHRIHTILVWGINAIQQTFNCGAITLLQLHIQIQWIMHTSFFYVGVKNRECILKSAHE